MGSEGVSPDILGIEMTPTMVRAVRLDPEDRTVVAAAECPVLAVGEAVTLDPAALGPALDEVLYHLGVDDRANHLAAVSIGPPRAGVGSGPALPAWLEHRSRQLGENMVYAGKLGIAFCPQRALDTAIMICEQANITVSRIDFVAVAAARVLEPGVDTISVGSGRGWQARLRDDEVLEALESGEVDSGEPLLIVNDEGDSIRLTRFHGVTLGPDVEPTVDEIGFLAAAVGAALGIAEGSSANLLDGETIRGRHVGGFGGEVGGSRPGDRTTVDLARGQDDSDARSVIREASSVVEPYTGTEEFDIDPMASEPEVMGRPGDRPYVPPDTGAHTAVHPDDPIQDFSPEPGSESSMDYSGPNMALIIAGIAIFTLAVAVGIFVAQS